MNTCKHCHSEPVLDVETLIASPLYTIRCPGGCVSVEATEFALAVDRWEYKNTVWTLCSERMPEKSGTYMCQFFYQGRNEDGEDDTLNRRGIMEYYTDDPLFIQVNWLGTDKFKTIKMGDYINPTLQWTELEFPPGEWTPEEDGDKDDEPCGYEDCEWFGDHVHCGNCGQALESGAFCDNCDKHESEDTDDTQTAN